MCVRPTSTIGTSGGRVFFVNTVPFFDIVFSYPVFFERASIPIIYMTSRQNMFMFVLFLRVRVLFERLVVPLAVVAVTHVSASG